GILRLLFVHEMKMLLRARRTVIMAIVLPAVIMPLMLYAQKYSANRRERQLIGTTYRYAITGPLADRTRLLINQTRDSLGGSDDESLERLLQFKFIESSVVNAQESLDRNEIEFYIETMTGDQADNLAKPAPPARSAGASKTTSA